MKRLFFSLAMISSFLFAFGQGEMDALKYSQTDIRGTARYTSMAGAMGALGGDVSAISDNPAALGIFRTWTLNLTPGIVWTSTNNSGNKDFTLGGTFDNFGFVASFLTKREQGAVAHNIGINYNRLRNFQSNISTNKYDSYSSLTDYMASNGVPNPLRELGYEGYMINELDEGGYESAFPGERVDIRYNSKERGSIDEWNFSYSANISNFLYLGATVGVQSIDYSLNTTHSEDFESGGYFDLYNDLWTYGSGVNLKLGAIARPLDFLRVGVSFTTPTIYDLKNKYNDEIHYYDTKNPAGVYSPRGSLDYSLNTPYKLMGSLGFIIGEAAVIGINYEMKDYATARYAGNYFSNHNRYIKEDFKISHTVKVGGEYRLNEKLGLRAGYAITTSPVKDIVEKSKREIMLAGSMPSYVIPQRSSYYSLGFGYQSNFFYFDAAYLLNVRNDNLYLYPPPNSDFYAEEKMKTQTFASNIILTFGIRF